MNPIVRVAIDISRERYIALGQEQWPGLAPQDCFEAILCFYDQWLKLSPVQRSRIYSSMTLRLADGYKLNKATCCRGMAKAKKNAAKPKHRSTILARDSFACCYCGSRFDLQLDHVVPRSRGGTDTAGNLLTACQPCNLAKRDRHLANEQEWLATASKANRSINLPDDTKIAL